MVLIIILFNVLYNLEVISKLFSFWGQCGRIYHSYLYQIILSSLYLLLPFFLSLFYSASILVLFNLYCITFLEIASPSVIFKIIIQNQSVLKSDRTT